MGNGSFTWAAGESPCSPACASTALSSHVMRWESLCAATLLGSRVRQRQQRRWRRRRWRRRSWRRPSSAAASADGNGQGPGHPRRTDRQRQQYRRHRGDAASSGWGSSISRSPSRSTTPPSAPIRVCRFISRGRDSSPTAARARPPGRSRCRRGLPGADVPVRRGREQDRAERPGQRPRLRPRQSHPRPRVHAGRRRRGSRLLGIHEQQLSAHTAGRRGKMTA